MSSDSHWMNIPPQTPSRRPMGMRLVAALLVVAIAFLGGLVGGMVGSNSATTGGSPLVTAVTMKPEDIGDTNIARAASAIAASVVTIESTTSGGGATGTGIIISSDGQILTNSHVIEGATKVVVRLNGATSAVRADILAEDAGNDLAIVKIQNATGLTAATFANAESIAVGDTVVAVGYALGLDGGPSVTSGIVSALNRTITDENGALNGLIQTDAAISSGNSGGPLINLSGQVIGVNTAVARGDMGSSANNIGFAIGVAEVKRVTEILQAEASGTKRQQGYLGISLGNRQDGGSGAVITEVQADSPADKAGIKVDDIVLEINGEMVSGQGALIGIIRDSQPGDKVTIIVERDKVRKTLIATLVARPSE